jgi:hypothetical protein
MEGGEVNVFGDCGWQLPDVGYAIAFPIGFEDGLQEDDHILERYGL